MPDVIIAGGGISGLAAALFTAKAGLKTLVFDGGESQIQRVSTVWNYPGVVSVSGKQLLEQCRKQATEAGAEIRDEEVVAAERSGDRFAVKTASGSYEADYLVIATNLNAQLATGFGFEPVVNEKVPSGRIKRIKGIEWDGKTDIPNLYIAGLLAGIPSQAVIAAGQGAAVGVEIASRATGNTYMWHDV